MARILVLFASIDGQTARIAARIGERLAAAGHFVTQLEAGAPQLAKALGASDALVVGGGIRYGHHSRALQAAVRAHRAIIAARPGAFFSVCLTAGGPGARPAAAARYVADFLAITGWAPLASASFAGALRYSKYNLFTRLLMRLIVGVAGGDTDASRDYEYTDWREVERFADEFAARLGPAATP